MDRSKTNNVDPAVVDDFGREWATYDQSELQPSESSALFERYFSVFPWEIVGPQSKGMDVGCGSGRWAKLVAPRVGELYCIDPSQAALDVARRNLQGLANCRFHCADTSAIPVPDGSLDFGYSLGVLHHVPDTQAALRACVTKLKPGAPFLVYLYYALDNRPVWFRLLWRATDLARRCISRLPFRFKLPITQLIGAVIYWPLARLALLAERLGCEVDAFPLAIYRHRSFYTMRTDALDRFGTRLEQRFSSGRIEHLMEEAGLRDIRFRSQAPYWCAVGTRASSADQAFE